MPLAHQRKSNNNGKGASHHEQSSYPHQPPPESAAIDRERDDPEVAREDVKTVQELMRHANSSVTLNLYAQAVTDPKRNAQSKVARLVFAEKSSTEG